MRKSLADLRKGYFTSFGSTFKTSFRSSPRPASDNDMVSPFASDVTRLTGSYAGAAYILQCAPAEVYTGLSPAEVSGHGAWRGRRSAAQSATALVRSAWPPRLPGTARDVRRRPTPSPQSAAAGRRRTGSRERRSPDPLELIFEYRQNEERWRSSPRLRRLAGSGRS